MATASSAQREPSMEEILASIRRIIEDSDSGRKPTEAYDLRQDLEPGPADRTAVEADAFHAEFRDGAEAGKPVTLAGVQAQLSAAERANARAGELARSEPASPRPSMTLAEIGAEANAVPAESDAPASASSAAQSETIVTDWRRALAAAGEPPQAASGFDDSEPDQPLAETPDSASSEAEIEIFEDELVEPQAPLSRIGAVHRAGEDEASTGRPAILSEHAGRQVAAAFGELSEVFAARDKKSFDEMAEDMLRPMLQDWLDNNLPTLVERLVREEIERVARGA